MKGESTDSAESGILYTIRSGRNHCSYLLNIAGGVILYPLLLPIARGARYSRPASVASTPTDVYAPFFWSGSLLGLDVQHILPFVKRTPRPHLLSSLYFLPFIVSLFLISEHPLPPFIRGARASLLFSVFPFAFKLITFF